MNLNQLIKEHIKDENNNLLPQGYFMWKQLLNSINTK